MEYDDLLLRASPQWRRKLRQRLELFEGRRLDSPQALLDAFFKHRQAFPESSRTAIAALLSVFCNAKAERCLTCGVRLNSQQRYFCSTLCAQEARIRPLEPD